MKVKNPVYKLLKWLLKNGEKVRIVTVTTSKKKIKYKWDTTQQVRQ